MGKNLHEFFYNDNNNKVIKNQLQFFNSPGAHLIQSFVVVVFLNATV